MNAAWEEIFASSSQSVRAIGRALHECILRCDPGSVIVSYPGYKAVSYGVGAKKNSEAYSYVMPQKDRCNLGFYRGAALNDPDGLLEGTGKELRHVKVRDIASAKSEAVFNLVESAINERKSALGVH